MAFQSGRFQWDVAAIGRSLLLEESDVLAYFKDGRRVSFLLERRIAREVLNGTLAPSEGAGYDVLDAHGRKWEVRSISRGGVYFCPSYMVGSGRQFDEPGFLKKLSEIQGYVLSDIESFPDVPYWVIPGDHVKQWWIAGHLGSASKIDRRRALSLVRIV